MKLLEYRTEELFDRSQRAALIDDMLTHYTDPGMAAFLYAVDAILTSAEDDAKDEITELRATVEGLEDDLEAERASNDELRADVAYWKARAND